MREQLTAPPPRQLSEVPTHLSRGQRRGLQRALKERRRPDPLVVSGGVDLILFFWERRGRTDLLVMVCKGVEDKVEAIAVQPGPKDDHSLILRAGPDSATLRTQKAVLFGTGALGGHTATLLAESGLGSLKLVDPDVLLPGNVVRHIAGHGLVGARQGGGSPGRDRRACPLDAGDLFPRRAAGYAERNTRPHRRRRYCYRRDGQRGSAWLAGHGGE